MPEQFTIAIWGVRPGGMKKEEAEAKLIAAIERAMLSPDLQAMGFYMNGIAFKPSEQKVGKVHESPATA